MNNKTKHFLYLDILNVMACICVIAMHHNGLVFFYDKTSAWKQSLIVECVCYWAVPVFLMISGANLLGYHEKYDTKTFAKKRILRTVVPWLSWSVIILLWKVVTGQIEMKKFDLGFALDQIFNYKVEPVYWFFGTLFACYLAIPILSLLIKNRKIMWYMVIMNFLFLSVLPACKVWLGFEWNMGVPFVSGLIIYIILGYLITTTTIDKNYRIIIYVLGILAVLFRYFYTLYESQRIEKLDVSIKGYGMFYAVFLSVAVFICMQQINWEGFLSEKVCKCVSKISSYSFGVYLVHRIVMYYEQYFLELDVHRLLWRIVFVPVTYLCSLLIIFCLKKIPVLKKILC